MIRTEKRACAVCGMDLRPDVLRCTTCGQPVPAAETVVMPASAFTGEAAAPARRWYTRWFGVIGLLVATEAIILGWWTFAGNSVPGFDSVLDFKVAAASLVAALALVQGLSAAVMYGAIPLRGAAGDVAAFLHRWSGRTLVPVAAVVAVFCVRDIGPQSTPTRVAVHSVLGTGVVVLLLAKLVILRGVPRLSGLVPVLGMLAVASFLGLWYTSAYAVIRDENNAVYESTAPAAGSTTQATVLVTIVSDPRTIGRFEPQAVRVKVGQTVEWVNQDRAPHQIVRQGGGFDLGRMAPGTSVRWTAQQPGTVTYLCSIHPRMAAATVVVER